MVGFCLFTKGQAFTFNNGSGDGLWNTASNWDQGSVPSGSDDISIPSGQTVTYDVNADFTFTGSSFSISGTLDFNGQKIKLKGTPSSITIGATAIITNLKELSFENTSNGSIASGASLTVEDLKLKNFAALSINTNCINVTNKLAAAQQPLLLVETETEKTGRILITGTPIRFPIRKPKT